MSIVNIITVQIDGEVTRIVVGCEEMATDLAARLVHSGHVVKVQRSEPPLNRSEAETHRATRLIAQLYGN